MGQLYKMNKLFPNTKAVATEKNKPLLIEKRRISETEIGPPSKAYRPDNDTIVERRIETCNNANRKSGFSTKYVKVARDSKKMDALTKYVARIGNTPEVSKFKLVGKVLDGTKLGIDGLFSEGIVPQLHKL